MWEKKGPRKIRVELRGRTAIAVAKTTNSFDQSRSFMIALDLSAAVTDIKAYHVQRTNVFPAPNLVQQLILAQDLIRVSSQNRQ